MTEPRREDEGTLEQIIEASSMALGRRVLGREPTPEESSALRSILNASAQALAEGFIRRLADHVLAERREESIEGFFEGHVKTD
ncbi:MAG: hypothetical protein U0790_04940 [Isosphaeraceae bacterium]